MHNIELEKGPEEIIEGPAMCSKQTHLEQVSWVNFQLGFEHLQAHVQPLGVLDYSHPKIVGLFFF